MIVSPSIASSDILHVAKEVDFAVKTCNQIHLDVEDGVAVQGISFGMKMCKKIKEISENAYISLHLEVFDPLCYLEELKELKPDIIFVQTDHLKNRECVLKAFKASGLNCGVSLSDRDLEKDNEKIIELSDQVMVLTASLSDPKQQFQIKMADYAQRIAYDFAKKVWIDGGISCDIYEELSYNCPDVYAAVMGRGFFGDKDAFKAIYKGREKCTMY